MFLCSLGEGRGSPFQQLHCLNMKVVQMKHVHGAVAADDIMAKCMALAVDCKLCIRSDAVQQREAVIIPGAESGQPGPVNCHSVPWC
jgi:hypothetical protein